MRGRAFISCSLPSVRPPNTRLCGGRQQSALRRPFDNSALCPTLGLCGFSVYSRVQIIEKLGHLTAEMWLWRR